MKKYYLIGCQLSHSMSQPIHEMLFESKNNDASYEIIDFPESEFEQKINWLRENANGFNCTIPYKQMVIPHLDFIDQAAKLYGAVNTVKVIDGKLYGYNTDCSGFNCALKKADITLKDVNVTVLGNGGVSRMMAFETVFNNAKNLYICARTSSKAELLANEIEEYSKSQGYGCNIEISNFTDIYDKQVDVILNGTPIGMWPNLDLHLLNLDNFEKLVGVFDTIYNPLKTNLIKQAGKRNINHANGLSMLVYQAIKAQEIWFDMNFDNEIANEITQKMQRQILLQFPIPIILTGFMGAGKSTIARKLAQEIGYDFIDIDEEIVKKEGNTISEIFAKVGEKGFREIEQNVFKENLKNGFVIATGGGLSVQPQNIDIMKEKYCINVYLQIDFETSWQRTKNDENRPLLNNARELFETRKNIYSKNADIVVAATNQIDEVVHDIIKNFN